MFRTPMNRAFSATSMSLATGVITSFNRQKGFGFVEEGSGDSKKSHFVHFSVLNVEGGYKAVEQGTQVEFDVAPDERNPDRTRAINVCAPGGRPLPAPERREFDNNRQGGGDRGSGGGYRGRGGDRGGRGRGGGGGGYRGGNRDGGNRDGGNRNYNNEDF